MGIQKYRNDRQGEKSANGYIPCYSDWNYGPSLAMIKNCPMDNGLSPRTVYIQGEADTFFSIPAAINVKGKTVKGWISCDDEGFIFHQNKDHANDN